MITLPSPDLQIAFSHALAAMREECLIDALSKVVKSVDTPIIDAELASLAPGECLRALASRGLRGELVFAVPTILRANPKLITYYRLLLGFSQKSFYSHASGTSRFKSMEDGGKVNVQALSQLPELCHELALAAVVMLKGIGVDRVSRELLDDLTLLTLGPQLRGGANVRKSTQGIEVVFDAIHKIVERQCLKRTSQRMELRNAAKRHVVIEFAADPDIVIRERMSERDYRNIIAIEIKAGTDFSNIHNRLGEAEKSHQKARQAGFVECWTIVNVDRMDLPKAKRESPSTNRFYRISTLISGEGEEYADFRNRIVSLTGITGRRPRD